MISKKSTCQRKGNQLADSDLVARQKIHCHDKKRYAVYEGANENNTVYKRCRRQSERDQRLLGAKYFY